MPDYCIPVISKWAREVILWKGLLAFSYRDGFCCDYPQTDPRHFELALISASKGRWVWDWLGRLPHRIRNYRPLKNP